MSGGELPIGAVLAGRYRLGHKLGEGGMGTVYAAANHLGKRFAVKVLHGSIASQDPSAVDRFFLEARASARLDSPHIVRVLDAGVDEAEGARFLVMELLEGCDADALLADKGPLDPPCAALIALQAARGLAAAHAAGITHRDIKPANLFLDMRESGDVLVKVCDFGIAKVMAERGRELTRTGSLLGSPLYFSPEQVQDAKRVDARTDVWSLGVSLYRLLSGAAPHEEVESIPDLLTAICGSEVPHLQDRAPWIGPDLASVVHGALRRANARFRSMDAFAAALSQVAGGGPRLTRSMLRATPSELRAVRAVRAELPRQDAPEDQPSSDRLIGRTLSGRYRITRLLGRGGMGAVYEAEGAVGKRFAVKVMTEAVRASEDARRRFVREARAASAIESPHVVPVLDADTDAATGMPFLVMDLLAGTDLDRLLEEVGAVEPVVLTRLFVQACRGLGAAHAKSIIHRDIKPANLFLDRTSGEVVLKIGDFGIAKTTSTEAINQSTAALTRTGGVLGSPLYMSPEQSRNAKHVDPRTDIWSLCLSMYEAYSGQRPWEHCTTIGELILAICTEDLPPLSDLAPWLEPGLVAVVHRGLRRDVRERWPDVGALIDALRPFVGNTERVGIGMLVGVSAERRRHAEARRAVESAPTVDSRSQPRPRRSDAVAGAESTVGLSATRSGSAPRRWRAGLAVAGSVAAAFLLWSAARWRSDTTATADASAHAEAAPPERAVQAAAASTTTVAIEPDGGPPPPSPPSLESATASATATPPTTSAHATDPRRSLPRTPATTAPAPPAVAPASTPAAATPSAAPKAPKLQSSW